MPLHVQPVVHAGVAQDHKHAMPIHGKRARASATTRGPDVHPHGLHGTHRFPAHVCLPTLCVDSQKMHAVRVALVRKWAVSQSVSPPCGLSHMAGAIPPNTPGSPGSPGSPGGDSLLDVVPTLVQGLAENREEDEQVECLLQLAQIVDSSFGDRSYRLCARIVEHGGVMHLARLCGHPREWLHQTAMLVLGNLAADSTDVQAAFKSVGGFELLIPHVFSDSPSTVTFALGAIRNTCGDPDCVGIMQKLGAMRRLQVRGQCLGAGHIFCTNSCTYSACPASSTPQRPECPINAHASGTHGLRACCSPLDPAGARPLQRPDGLRVRYGMPAQCDRDHRGDGRVSAGADGMTWQG